MTKYQCVKCLKLFENWLDLDLVMLDNTAGYFLCSECQKERIIVSAKSLNSSEVVN